MRTYEVLVTPDACDDLTAIRNYISRELESPKAARSTLRSIRETVASLSTMPARTRPVGDEPWQSRGIRRILSGSFFIYYRVDESAGKVYVLNVVYARGQRASTK